jgi:hypothetical protein
VIAFLLSQYYKGASGTPLSKEILDMIKEEARGIISLRIQQLIEALDSEEGVKSWERNLMRYESSGKMRENVRVIYKEAVKVFELTVNNAEVIMKTVDRGVRSVKD